jgi:hypothetical protein
LHFRQERKREEGDAGFARDSRSFNFSTCSKARKTTSETTTSTTTTTAPPVATVEIQGKEEEEEEQQADAAPANAHVK